jgi:segregation and condensation protein A
MSGTGENQDLTSRISGNERKKLSEPPIDVLFNPSLILKRDAWDIDVASMLRMLLDILERVKYKDLRICGIAALSSSMIHRIKVESIFKLQSMSEKKSKPSSHPDEVPIENLSPLTIPFRYESSYPVSLQELLSVLESMISNLTESGTRKPRISIEPVEDFSFEEYFIKIEEILAQFETMIRTRVFELATPAASWAAAAHGGLVDSWGFPASFIFGIAAAVVSMGLVLLIHERAGGKSES